MVHSVMERNLQIVEGLSFKQGAKIELQKYVTCKRELAGRMDSLESLKKGGLGDYYINGNRVYYYNNRDIESCSPGNYTINILNENPDYFYLGGKISGW